MTGPTDLIAAALVIAWGELSYWRGRSAVHVECGQLRVTCKEMTERVRSLEAQIDAAGAAVGEVAIDPRTQPHTRFHLEDALKIFVRRKRDSGSS